MPELAACTASRYVLGTLQAHKVYVAHHRHAAVAVDCTCTAPRNTHVQSVVQLLPMLVLSRALTAEQHC